MSPHEQNVVRELLDAVIVKNQLAGALERVSSVIKPAAKEKKISSTKSASNARRLAHAGR